MPSLRLLFTALLVSHAALAQVAPPPVDEGEEAGIDFAREEQIADQIERLRTDPRWVAFAAAWRRREESVLPPRSLEPLLPLAQRAAEAFNTLTVGLDAAHVETIEVPQGLMFSGDGDETPPPRLVFNWYGFEELAQNHGLPEDHQFFTLMAEDSTGITEETAGCMSLVQELSRYGQWRAFTTEYPHAFVRVARQKVSEAMSQLTSASRSTDDAESAIATIQQFVEEHPVDPLTPMLRTTQHAIESGRLAMQAECVPPPEDGGVETTTSAAMLREVRPMAPARP